MPNSTVCLSFDFDAMSVWFGYKNVTPAMLYRGEYGARVGVPRLLHMLDRLAIRATFFVPGHTIESFPEVTQAILAGGHEIGHHSYAHVDPSEQTADEERRDMERAWKALERIGLKPLGFRSPSADYSSATLALIEEFNFLYDSSLMADDYRPYHPRLGDQVTQQSPLVKGAEARVWELPICFEFDDWVHFQFNFNPYRNGTSAPSKVLEIWTAEFDWMHANVDGGILNVAMHPQVIGRGHRVAMLEHFITHCLSRGSDVKFERMGDVAKRLNSM
ncbi:MAG: polysaccharide deacetylase [Chloroflexi bacterium]|nr:polysaccharide deacetylase [Chloroflexota bacterium]